MTSLFSFRRSRLIDGRWYLSWRTPMIGGLVNGVCGGLVGAVLGFTIADWQWWLVMAAVIVARANGQVRERKTAGMRIRPQDGRPPIQVPPEDRPKPS